MANIQEIESSEYALEVDELSYAFKNHQALDKVSFKVKRGALHGFVGPNGAGKTTTLKLVSTLLTPRPRHVQVFGMDAARQAKKVRRYTGFMPDNFAMYRPMKVFEYLDFFAAAYGQSLEQRDRTIDDVLELTDMTKRKRDLIRGLSRGMQQRVCLARVLVHDPALLLLDEPASGLDPRARIELMEILKELVRIGKTIFISSHILSELATLCDSVTIIDRGQVKYTGDMAGLLQTASGGKSEYEVALAMDVPGVLTSLQAVPGVDSVVRSEDQPAPTFRVVVDGVDADTSPILQALLARGARVASLRRMQRQLDEAFMDLTEPGVRS